ncbi:uncharacterized protein [Ptychodera flava]|uniref:uncharacterized protein n=1 Tax=Ptychodera flava TaxID=63121 RepID=UPI00396A7BF9
MAQLHSCLNNDSMLAEQEDKVQRPDTVKNMLYQRHLISNSHRKWIVILILFTTWLFWLLWYLNTRTSKVKQYGDLIVLPQEHAKLKGAYCLDGSAPGYYFRKGSGNGRKSWVIYLQGGGWCFSISECYERSFTNFGSSDEFPPQYSFDGFLSNDARTNPDFYNWNVAYFAYCDGASFAGNVDKPVKINGRNIYFRGKRILDLLLDHLLEHGLSKADRVILSGVSAGGLATFIHADYIRSRLPQSVNFCAFPDAGYFPDVKNITNFQHIRGMYQKVFKLQEVQGSLNKDCLAALGNDPWKCFFPQYSHSFIKTRMFILNSAYDYWTMWFIIHLRCHPSLCNIQSKNYYSVYYKDFMNIAKHLYDSAKDGVYTSSCYAHSQAAFDREWFTVLVNGTTPQKAFSDWYFGRKSVQESKYWDCTTPACNPTCDWSVDFYVKVTSRLKETNDFYV